MKNGKTNGKRFIQAKSDDLFQLIHSMDRTEKRRCATDICDKSDQSKKNTSRLRYLDLYQAMNKMDSYDESKLKKKFPKLADDKNKLYDIIMKILRDYHFANRISFQIDEFIHYAQLQKEKGLANQALRSLSRAKELAVKVDDNLKMAIILKMESEINILNLSSENDVKIAKDVVENYMVSIEKVEEETRFFVLHKKIGLERELHSRENAFRELEKFAHEFEVNKEEFKSVSSNVNYLKAKYHWLSSRDDLQAALETSKQLVNVYLEKLPINEENITLITIYINYSTNCLFKLFKYKEVEKYIDLIDSLIKKFKGVSRNKVLFHRFNNLIVLYMNTKRYKEATLLSSEIEIVLEQQSSINSTTEQLNLMMNVLTCSMVIEDWLSCAKWSTHIQKMRIGNIRKHHKNIAPIFQLIAAIELEDFDKIDKLFVNSNLYYKKNTTLSKEDYEIVLRQCLKDYSLKVTKKEKQQCLVDMKDYLTYQRKNNKVIKAGIDILAYWTYSKIHNRSISDLLSDDDFKLYT